MPRAWSGRDQNCTRILLRLAKSMTALVGAVGAPSVSGVTQKVPRSITSVFFPCVLSAIVATVPPKPVPMTMASKASCAAASLEANAPSPAATAPTAALFTASRRVTDMRSFLVIVASYRLVPVKAEPVECDEKVCPEDRRIDEAAHCSREHHDREIVRQNSQQVARQNEQDDQECEDVGERVRDAGRYTFGPVFMVGEIDEG